MKRLISVITVLVVIMSQLCMFSFPASAETTNAKVLFSDDFESGQIDTSKWSPIDGCPMFVGEDPDDSSNKVLVNGVDKAKNAWSHLVTNSSFSDFTLTMRVYILNDLTGTFGVDVRISGDECFQTAFNSAWKGQFGYSGGGDIYDSKLVITPDAWHDVRLIAVGSSYELYVDGDLVQSAQDSHLSSGQMRIGFWDKAFYIDEFTVYEGKVEESSKAKGNTTYYVDDAAASKGDGLSPETAWNSLAQISRAKFGAGDKILFKCGGKYTGTILSLRGSGEDGNPITVSSYGEGALPVIDAAIPITKKSGFATIEMNNTSFWVFENLQIQNSNPDNPGVPEVLPLNADGSGSLPMRGGISVVAKYVNGQNSLTIRSITVRNCKFTCVDGSGGDEGNSFKNAMNNSLGCGGGCISVSASSSDDGQFNAWVDGFTVENCTFYNYAGTAVNTAFAGEVYNKNVVVRNNLFYCDEDYTGSNHAAYICHADSPIIEYNVFRNLTCGTAFQVVHDGTMRYNICMNMDGYQHGASTLSGKELHWDGCAFDVDSSCSGEFNIYGNVTTNCFSGTFSSFNFDETKATINIENNYSYNDKTVIFTNEQKLKYKLNINNNNFIRDEKTKYDDMDAISIEGPSQINSIDTPLLKFNSNLFSYPDQRVRIYAKACSFENNGYYGDFKGNNDETKEHQYNLKFSIPELSELEKMSYCGNIEGTESFCDSGYFKLTSDSDCYDTDPVIGVDFKKFEAGREYWGQKLSADGSAKKDKDNKKDSTGIKPIYIIFIAAAVVIVAAAAATVVIVSRKKKALDTSVPDNNLEAVSDDDGGNKDE